LREGDLTRFGWRMAESHTSLRDDYEVSCAELDLMVEIANRQPGVRGARMTGGGFGGCTINLVDAQHAEKFRERVAGEYEAATERKADIYICTTADGAGEVSLS
jgi:galactokinase